MNIENENKISTQPVSTDVVTADYSSSDINSTIASTQQTPNHTNFLSDPTYSGAGTWIGTVISVIAAIVAIQQARKAATIMTKIQTEQNRQYTESARRLVEQLDGILTPILKTELQRGTKVVQVVDAAKAKCHDILKLPLDNDLTKVPDSIRIMEGLLVKFSGIADIGFKKDAKTEDIAELLNLQRAIREKIQLSLRSCTEYTDSLVKTNT